MWNPLQKLQQLAREAEETKNRLGRELAETEKRLAQELKSRMEGRIPKEVQAALEDAVQDVVKEAVKVGQAIGDVVSTKLPGMAPKEKTPYKHIVGTTPHESILLSGMLFDLKESSVLTGLAQRTDGKWYLTEIDLNNHYANKLGKFDSDSGGFKHTARNMRLEPPFETSVTLKGELADTRNWVEAQVDLSVCIVIKDGRFVFERHDGFFDRDGFLAQKTEGLPLVGYVTAIIQGITGNEDHAQRALARCTESTIIVIAAIGGTYGGGILGGALAAGLATPLAMIAESHIAKSIKDPRIRAEFEEATIGSALVESLTNMVAGAAGGAAGKYVGQWLSKYGTGMVSKVLTKGAKTVAKKGTKEGIEVGLEAIDAASEAMAIQLIQKVAKVMEGDQSQMNDWKQLLLSLDAQYGMVKARL